MAPNQPRKKASPISLKARGKCGILEPESVSPGVQGKPASPCEAKPKANAAPKAADLVKQCLKGWREGCAGLDVLQAAAAEVGGLGSGLGAPRSHNKGPPGSSPAEGGQEKALGVSQSHANGAARAGLKVVGPQRSSLLGTAAGGVSKKPIKARKRLQKLLPAEEPAIEASPAAAMGNQAAKGNDVCIGERLQHGPRSTGHASDVISDSQPGLGLLADVAAGPVPSFTHGPPQQSTQSTNLQSAAAATAQEQDVSSPQPGSRQGAGTSSQPSRGPKRKVMDDPPPESPPDEDCMIVNAPPPDHGTPSAPADCSSPAQQPASTVALKKDPARCSSGTAQQVGAPLGKKVGRKALSPIAGATVARNGPASGQRVGTSSQPTESKAGADSFPATVAGVLAHGGHPVAPRVGADSHSPAAPALQVGAVVNHPTLGPGRGSCVPQSPAAPVVARGAANSCPMATSGVGAKLRTVLILESGRGPGPEPHLYSKTAAASNWKGVSKPAAPAPEEGGKGGPRQGRLPKAALIISESSLETTVPLATSHVPNGHLPQQPALEMKASRVNRSFCV